MKKYIAIAVLMLGLTVVSEGQTIYQAGPKGCLAFARQVQEQVQVTHASYPSDWRIIVACTDGEWDSILTHFGFNGVSNYAFTWRDAHKLTVIRGTEFSRLTDAQQRFVVLHELGHIVLQTSNEDKADDYARQHMKTIVTLPR